MKILMMSSDTDSIGVLEKLLRRHKYDVTILQGTEDMEQQLSSGVYDMIILDFDVRETNCPDLIQSIRKFFSLPSVLFISKNKEEKCFLLEAGADDWIGKPYDIDLLEARINALARRVEPLKQK